MYQVEVGATDVTVYVYFVDDDGGTAPGEPTTGLLFSDIETGGSASTMREGAARADLTLITQTVAGAHSDGGFIEVDATNMPGVYRLDLPDVFATGADFVIAMCVAAAANNSIMRPVVIRISESPAVNVTEWLGTAAATPSVAGVPEVDVTHFVGTLAPTPNTTGVPDVNTVEILDTAPSLTTGDLDVNVATMAAGSVSAAAIGTDAIDADAIAADAVTELRSIFSGTADAGGTTTTIRDAALTEIDDTWIGNWVLITSGTDANRCRLITEFAAGTDDITFAPAVSSAIGAGVTYEIIPNAAVDIQSWLGTEAALAAPNALVGGAVDADVSAIQAAAITAAAIATDAIGSAEFSQAAADKVWSTAARVLTANTNLNDPTAAAIADAVWDEDIEAAHGTDATAGLLLRVLGAVISNRSNNATLDALLGVADTASNDVPNQILDGDTMAELSQGIPAATPTLAAGLMLLYMALRDKLDTTATLKEIHNDAGTVIAKATLSDDGTTFTKEEFVSGP